MGLISQIKADVAKSGTNKQKILYIRSDSKVRIRFLQELDDGYSFVFHDNFNEGVNCFCPKNLDEDNDCIYCEEKTNTPVRTRNLYTWSIYNYDTKQVEVALFAVNRISPVNQFITMAESYGTIMDRDYIISKTGKSFDTIHTVIPQDKEKFRNPKAKPFSKDAIEKILAAAFPYEGGSNEEEPIEAKLSKPKKFAKMEDEEIPFDVDEDEEEEEAPKKKAKSGISEEYIEQTFEDNDIDEDDFMEYHELKSLKKLKDKSKSEFKAMVKEYLEALEEDEDDEEEEEEE